MKRPRFFCETCGTEVPLNAKQCPRCGRYFASVRCPACGFTGEEGLFDQGCPVCGYSAPPSPVAAGRGNPPPGKRAAGALPLWVYILTAAVFLGALAALFLTLVP
jgi:rRNA maturation protein Nop10